MSQSLGSKLAHSVGALLQCPFIESKGIFRSEMLCDFLSDFPGQMTLTTQYSRWWSEVCTYWLLCCLPAETCGVTKPTCLTFLIYSGGLSLTGVQRALNTINIKHQGEAQHTETTEHSLVALLCYYCHRVGASMTRPRTV